MFLCWVYPQDEVVSDAVVIPPGEEGEERHKDHLYPTAPLKSTTHTGETASS